MACTSAAIKMSNLIMMVYCAIVLINDLFTHIEIAGVYVLNTLELKSTHALNIYYRKIIAFFSDVSVMHNGVEFFHKFNSAMRHSLAILYFVW